MAAPYGWYGHPAFVALVVILQLQNGGVWSQSLSYEYLDKFTWHFQFPSFQRATPYSFNAYNFAVQPQSRRLVTRVTNVHEVRVKSQMPRTHVLGNIENYLMAFDVTPTFFRPLPPREDVPVHDGIHSGAVLPFAYGRHMLYPLYAYMEEHDIMLVKAENNGLKDPVILDIPGTDPDDLFLLVQTERDMFQGRTQTAIARYKIHHAGNGTSAYSHVYTICLKLPGKEEWRIQKNWIPIVRGSHLDLIVYVFPEKVIYSIPLKVVRDPPTLYRVNASSVPLSVWQECVPALRAYGFSIAFLAYEHTARSALPRYKRTMWHGGKSALSVPQRRELWVMLHTKSSKGKRLYGFVALDADFPYAMRRMTPLFLFDKTPWWVQYCSDIWLSPHGKDVQGALSFNDRYVGMFSVPIQEVSASMTPL